ncbi:hypothetical protein [Hymenobacter negativus]|uniref:Uncharacterized protein n=1 Tax=Hymenobacter negativus TaxID=2795026 RepID=A0ABS0QAA8_9BACT|nr:hypothetical protein [Hymenobacter negativus]MBH8559613.1 hypothetical protein [Hymenobacter negativus]
MPPSSPSLLLRVAATWPLPGLGLLVLPDGPTPLLQPYALHTALAVACQLPDGTQQLGTATVEEVSHPGSAPGPVRGLLLDMGTASPVPPGTEIWLTGYSADELR